MSRRANRELLREMREDLEDEEFQDQLDDILEERYGYSQPYPMYPMMRPPVMVPMVWWNSPVFFGFNPMWASSMSWLQTQPVSKTLALAIL